MEFREARSGDAKLLFYWANEPYTRRNSFNPEPIEWDSHVTWLNSKIADPNSRIYLFFKEKDPVGVVRFDIGSTAVIGVTVAPDKRGQGLGKEIIKFGCNEFFK